MFLPTHDFSGCSQTVAEDLRKALMGMPFRQVAGLIGARHYGTVAGRYTVLVFRHPQSPGGLRIMVGCRWFTMAQAERHWRAAVKNGFGINARRRARQMLALLSVIKIDAMEKWDLRFRNTKVTY